jgi:hypothetical protein
VETKSHTGLSLCALLKKDMEIALQCKLHYSAIVAKTQGWKDVYSNLSLRSGKGIEGVAPDRCGKTVPDYQQA